MKRKASIDHATKRPRTLSAAFVRTVGRPGVYEDGRGGRGRCLPRPPAVLAKRFSPLPRIWTDCRKIRVSRRKIQAAHREIRIVRQATRAGRRASRRRR